MRHSGWTPSIVPGGSEQNVYIVLENFGENGFAYRETDAGAADRETTVNNMVEGGYREPVRVVAFNTAEGWSKDASEEIATAVLDRMSEQGRDVPHSLAGFLDRHGHRIGTIP
jgi:hypothetical protein